MSPASPQEIAVAKKVDKIAWVDYAEGRRNEMCIRDSL